MATLEEMRFNLWDGFDMVVEAINSWKPRKCKTERDFESSLLRHLQKKFSSLKVVRQFAIGTARADIAVQDKILIELKNKLNSKSELDRLVGQMYEYRRLKKPFIIVICSKSRDDLAKQLRTIFASDFSDIGESSQLIIR